MTLATDRSAVVAGGRAVRPVMAVRRPSLPPGWPLFALFLGFPIWWVLGLSAFVLPIMAIPMAAWLLRQPSVKAPRGFTIWLAFIVWVLGTAIRVGGSDKLVHYTSTTTQYLAATVVLLYIFNISKDTLPAERVVKTLAIFWMFVVVWGFLGVLFPNFGFTSPVERIMPHRFAQNEFVHDLVHPALAQITDFLGYEQARPKAPFTYSTNWGAAFGLLTPFVVIAWKQSRSQRWRMLIGATFLLAIVPLVSSLDRGLWLSVGIGVTYAAVRLAIAGKGRALRTNMILIFTTLAVIWLSPLRGLVNDRLAHPHSNNRRISLYQESVSMVATSPVFGFGTPQPSVVNPNAPPVGTQGQLWEVLVSHGVPGAFFFVWWLVFQFWRFRRAEPELVLWCHTVILIALVQMPFYDSIGIPLAIIMIAIALASRELASTARSPVPADVPSA